MLTTIKRYFWVIFILLLPACGSGVTTTAPTEVDVNAISTQAVMTAVAQMTQAAAPTSTLTPTPTLTPRPTLTPLPFVALEGLRVAYIIEGNLYIQDSGKQPVQLTNSGQDSFPQFSDDGQLLIVHRGWEVYLINIDGSGERQLTISKLLAPLGLGYDKLAEVSGALAFVPGSHRLLFQTDKGDDLLLIDLDNDKIRQLFRPGSQVKYFQAAPNGKLALAWVGNELDAFSLDGQSMRRLTDYPPDGRVFRFGPEIYWSQDASKVMLILTLDKASDFSHPEPQIIRQYFLDGRRPVEIDLDPPPINAGGSDSYKISPDGNWIVYSYSSNYMSETKTPQLDGMYLGNLREGTTQFVTIGGPVTYYWSPDSIHFVVDDFFGTFLGGIDKEITPRSNWARLGFLGWLDNRRYIDYRVTMGEVGKEEKVWVVKIPPGLPYRDSTNFTFVFMNPK